MKFLSLLLLIICLAGCSAPEHTDHQPVSKESDSLPHYPFTFSKDHFGKIKPGMSAEEVTAIYGAENFVFDTLYGPEGITYPGYRLFPGKDAEAEVTFPEAGDPDSLGISIAVFKKGSPWRELDSGIGVGTSLDELVRLNTKKINFYGFGWDYGGLVSNFNDGNLTDGYRFKLDLDYNTISAETASALSGDQEIDSDFPPLEDAEVSVRAIFLSLYIE